VFGGYVFNIHGEKVMSKKKKIMVRYSVQGVKARVFEPTYTSLESASLATFALGSTGENIVLAAEALATAVLVPNVTSRTVTPPKSPTTMAPYDLGFRVKGLGFGGSGFRV
jgi:hypothetical protein